MADDPSRDVYSLEGVSFSYGQVEALKDISFTLRNGETLAVLGANGTGKSTLLKILNGLVFPTAGSLSFMGTPMTEEAFGSDFSKCFRERVGFLFPEPDVQLFCPTVFDEVAFGPMQLGLSADEAAGRAEELLVMLGISALGVRPPYTLSGGEKKKVALASVLAVNPDVILMDEPTNGLDPRSQVWLTELIERLKSLKKSFVISTHDLSLVEDLSDRVVLLDESHGVAAVGGALEILENKDLLLEVNIIHEHTHRHGKVVHTHSHGPYATHDDHD